MREMKDSGIEWIGEIPKEWKIAKLKSISNITTGNTPSKDINEYYENGIYDWIKPDNILDNFVISETKEKLTEL